MQPDIDFSKKINLCETWPLKISNTDNMTAKGYAQWACAYYGAAEELYAENNRDYEEFHFFGPVMQMTGLCAELTFKALLQGAGAEEKQLRTLGHNTYDAYNQAKKYFDEVEFIKLVFANTEHLEIPQEIFERLSLKDIDKPSEEWRVFFNQLRVLDGVYAQPYKSRYVAPGKVILPEPFIILVGLKIILSAMLERLNMKKLSGVL